VIDFIDRARLGQKVPGGQSLDDLVLGLKQLAKEIGPDDMVKVAKVRQLTQAYQNNLLKMRVDAGLISKETLAILKKTHPNYIPHNVIMDLDERVVKGLSQSLNVPKTDIMKAVGSAKNIKDPISATIQRTQIATRTIEKNKLLNNLVSVQEQSGMFPGMKLMYTGTQPGAKAIQVIKKSPLGFDNITLFKHGVKQVWQVPSDVAVAVKNLDAPLTPTWFKIATYPQKMLKKFATQYNLSFALPNKFRDKQTAALTSDSFIKELTKRYGLNPVEMKQIEKMGGWAKTYKTSGGYGSSIWKEGESTILKNLNKSGINKTLSATNPVNIINNINEAIEQSTRMEVFKKAVFKGLSLKDAAFVARDATIDFAKMGNWMKPLNQAIPFLNARVQGFVNLPRALISSPEAFTRMQMYTSVYPTMALHQHNRRFESYKNVSQYFKNRYWIIMTGEEDAFDSYTGQPTKVPQFISIVKGEGQQLVGNPIQYYLEKSDGIDYRKTSEMIADTLGSTSPMEFQTFSKSNWLMGLASQLGPGVSIPAGLGFGKHPYFGTDIVPESRLKAPVEMQFKKTTPEITKKLAGIIGVSPAKLEFVFSSFGGLPQDLQRAADIALNVVRDGKIGGNAITETPVGALTQMPILRRFFREAQESYSPEREYEQKQKEEIETKIIGGRLEIRDKAEEIFTEMYKRKTPEERLNYLNSLGDELTPEIKKKLKELKDSRQSVGVLSKNDSSELRARYILQKLDEMKSQGISVEDRVEYLDDLEKSKILTNTVKMIIAQLKNQ